MAASLAGSLALVTCREALHTGLGSHLAAYLKQTAAGADSRVLAEATERLVAANHGAGCHFIEQVAMDKASSDIEEAITEVRSPPRSPICSWLAPFSRRHAY